MSWCFALARVLALLYLGGMGLLCGWRYGDLPERWAYVGVALSILSAISFTALGVTKAAQVSQSQSSSAST